MTAARIVNPPQDPLANARLFLQERYDIRTWGRPLIIHQGGTFYAWDATCWPEVEERALRAQLYEHFEHSVYIHETKNGPEERPFQPNRYKVADLIDALRAATHIPTTVAVPSWLDGGNGLDAGDMIACQNGLLHVPTRELHPLTPTLYVHHSVPFDYDAGAKSPDKWLAFLGDLWGDDHEAIDTLQEIFGYLLSGDTRQQKMFMLVGPRRSGKGTVGRVTKALLGAHHVAGPTLAGLATNFGISPLIGRAVAIVSDARLHTSGTDIVTERLLSISGEDTLTVDRKYREPWTGKLPTRFLILSNELPRLADSSGALASRFIVLTLTRSWYGKENPTLTEELLEELPSILNWSLDGLERLRDRGHFVQPASSADAIRELEDLGSPMGAFVRDRCVVGPSHTVPCDELYQAWRHWCQDHGRDRPGTAQTFGRDLRAVLPGIKVEQPRIGEGGKQVRVYAGIDIASTAYSWGNRASSRVNVPDAPLTRDDTRTSPMFSQNESPHGEASGNGSAPALDELLEQDAEDGGYRI